MFLSVISLQSDVDISLSICEVCFFGERDEISFKPGELLFIGLLRFRLSHFSLDCIS